MLVNVIHLDSFMIKNECDIEKIRNTVNVNWSYNNAIGILTSYRSMNSCHILEDSTSVPRDIDVQLIGVFDLVTVRVSLGSYDRGDTDGKFVVTRIE